MKFLLLSAEQLIINQTILGCVKPMTEISFLLIAHHDITEILLKRVLNTIIQTKLITHHEAVKKGLIWVWVSKWSDLCTCRVLFQLQLTFVFSNLMGPWNKFESTLVRLKRSYENTGSVVLFNDERETTRVKFWRVKTSIACPYSRNDFKHSMFLLLFFFSPLNSLNFVKRLITSRYLFLFEWICLSVLLMFFTSCIVIKLHPSWRIFLCAILFIYNKLCVFIIQ
jgi:hypothetical protein